MSPCRPEAIDGPDATSATPASGGPGGELRNDLHKCDIVASGMAMLPGGGMLVVVEYLKLHAIGAHVVEPVLLEPHRRRFPC